MAFCPLDLALVPPRSRKPRNREQEHRRIKTTPRPISNIYSYHPPTIRATRRGSRRTRTESPEISPDPESGRGIPYGALFTLALIQMDALLKTADKPVLRDKPGISPRKRFRQQKTPSQNLENKKNPATQNGPLQTFLEIARAKLIFSR